MSDTAAEGLTEVTLTIDECDDLIRAFLKPDDYCAHNMTDAFAVVRRILADRLAAVQAEVLRLMAARDTYRKHAEADRDERDAARAEVEALRERVGALADDWAEAGPSLVRNAYDGSNVTEGQTFERCAAAVRAALEADR